MDSSTNKLVLVLYALLAALVGAVVLMVYQNFASGIALPIVANESANSQRQANRRSTADFSRRLREELAQLQTQNSELQAILAKREDVLRKQTSTLEIRTAESVELKQEADRYLDALLEIVSSSGQSLSENIQVLDQMDGSVADSQDLLTPAGEAASREQLEAALVTAEWELEQLNAAQTSSDEETAVAVQQLASLRQSILNSGEISVPLLVHLLTQTNSDLRQWAASSLGEVGADSSMAMDALLIAADDADENVRAAARDAIEAITGN